MTAIYDLVGWILAGFYALVPNYAVAIILLGITFMALVAPFTLKSTRSMLAMQKLQPKVKQLQEQHRNDKLAFNQAVTDLYRQEGVNPLGGCLPSLIPMPLLYVLYRVILGLSNKSKTCAGSAATKVARACPLYLDHHTRMYKDLIASAAEHPGQGASIHAFGIDLAQSAWTAITKGLGLAEIFGSMFLLLVMIAANYYQQLQIMNLNPMARQNQQANSQLKFMRLFPILFGIISIRFASALVLYYAVSALFRVGQQWAMYRFDPKVKALVAEDIGVVEARFSEIEHQPPKALPQTRRNGAARSSQDRLPDRRPASVPSHAQAVIEAPSPRPPVRRQASHNRKRKRR
ncbi:MAG: YidC/Oxa1 family membrane protein insertase [Acidimicrobiales bacterium]